jgi:hypothetical protein
MAGAPDFEWFDFCGEFVKQKRQCVFSGYDTFGHENRSSYTR